MEVCHLCPAPSTKTFTEVNLTIFLPLQNVYLVWLLQIHSNQGWLHAYVSCVIAQSSAKKASVLDLMFWCCNLKIHKNFWTKDPKFLFFSCTVPFISVAYSLYNRSLCLSLLFTLFVPTFPSTPHFHFTLSLTNHVASSDWWRKNRIRNKYCLWCRWEWIALSANDKLYHLNPRA